MVSDEELVQKILKMRELFADTLHSQSNFQIWVNQLDTSSKENQEFLRILLEFSEKLDHLLSPEGLPQAVLITEKDVDEIVPMGHPVYRDEDMGTLKYFVQDKKSLQQEFSIAMNKLIKHSLTYKEKDIRPHDAVEGDKEPILQFLKNHQNIADFLKTAIPKLESINEVFLRFQQTKRRPPKPTTQQIEERTKEAASKLNAARAKLETLLEQKKREERALLEQKQEHENAVREQERLKKELILSRKNELSYFESHSNRSLFEEEPPISSDEDYNKFVLLSFYVDSLKAKVKPILQNSYRIDDLLNNDRVILDKMFRDKNYKIPNVERIAQRQKKFKELIKELVSILTGYETSKETYIDEEDENFFRAEEIIEKIEKYNKGWKDLLQALDKFKKTRYKDFRKYPDKGPPTFKP